MEVIIPPRDHKPSTYRYTWDENGDVQRVERVNESVDYSSGRQTVQWPFQAHAYTESQPSIGTPVSNSFPRRATWQPRGLHRGENSPASVVDKDLIPDYVVNYIRGETPETLALKAALRPRGPHDVGIHPHEQGHRSRAADFYLSTTETNSRSGSHEDLERILPSGGGDGQGRDRAWMMGWRGGVAVNSFVSFLILLVAIVCLTLAVSKAQMLGGESAIYAGSCAGAERISWGLRAVISVFVVILVAIANYVFQILSSPTRIEVALAHERRMWLDIGIPSWRNLRHISSTRVLISAIILVAAFSTQLIFNAVIFTTQAGLSYSLVFVTEPFLSGAPFSNETATNMGMLSRVDILALQDAANRDQLVNLSSSECVSTFTGALQTDFSDVLLVTDMARTGSSLVQTSRPGQSLANFLKAPAGTAEADIALDEEALKYCLGQPGEGGNQCEVRLSGSLLGVVTLLNLVFVISVALTSLLLSNFRPLATLGDALNSFLTDPDHTTRHACLLTKGDVRQGRWGFFEAKYWVPRSHFWFMTPSLTRWATFLTIWALPTSFAAVGLGLSLTRNPTGELTRFGSSGAHEIYLFPEGTSRAGLALLAAFPHMVLAVLYMATNALLTTYFLSHELSQFAIPGTYLPLRLSSSTPRGAQFSSLYLTLPRPYSWLLMLLFAATGFALSNSLFVISVDFLPTATSTSTSGTPPPLSAIGTSGQGLLALVSLLVAILALVLGLGLRKADSSPTFANGLPAGNPMVLRGGSCSAVVSARCHGVGLEGDYVRGVAEGRVTWGVVREGEGMVVGHAGFSCGDVGMVNVGKTYA